MRDRVNHMGSSLARLASNGLFRAVEWCDEEEVTGSVAPPNCQVESMISTAAGERVVRKAAAHSLARYEGYLSRQVLAEAG
jgi:hypothetical protein